jgi:deazaflavin-dependent oxidoreductase (nitroreductase family)
MADRTYPPLPPRPVPSGTAGAFWNASRSAFRFGNRWFMVPLHQARLAAWLGTPLTGCQLLLTTTGRKSGLPRPTPLGYLIAEGAAWVMAGYGPSTLWYRNLLAAPRVEVLLPSRAPLPAVAEEQLDPVVRARIIPALVRSMALPGGIVGCNPMTAPDERILELTSWVPLIRIRPDGTALEPGPDDPGGQDWVWRQAVLGAMTLIGIRLIRKARRHRSH